jgi:hypothetical protein
MQLITKSLLICAALLFLFSTQCTSPTKSKPKKTLVTIADVWFSDAVDNDGDGFYSYARLNFDLDVNKSSFEAFVVIGVRFYDPADTAAYYEYFKSADFEISGTGSEDAKYISMGLPNTELPLFAYDFILQVFASSNESTPVAQAIWSDFDELGNVPVEESATDYTLNIWDCDWDNRIDNDGDGYYSQQDLFVDVDISDGATADIYLEIYVKDTGSSTYSLLAYTSDFNISGTSSSDAVSITINNGTHGLYDFKVVAYYANGIFSEDESDWNDDSDLGSVPMETAGEDPFPQYAWIDYNDGSFEDGYYWTTTGYFAVRFSQPAGATHCNVQRIRYHIYENSSNVFVRVWDNSGGEPGSYLYYTTTGDENYLIRYIWNTIYVDVDVSNSDPFYAGYFQFESGQPILSIDETTPLYGRSYYKSSTGSWVNDTGGDYAIEVYVQYTTTSASGKPIAKNAWLSAETN